MIQGKVFKIKNDKREKWNNWIDYLQGDLSQVLPDELKENQLLWETWSSFELDDRKYVIEEVAATEAFDHQNKEEPIHQLHQQVKEECLEPVDDLTFLSDVNQED